MSLQNLTREEFANKLHEHLRPSSPIQSFENLYGREQQLRDIEQALYSPGRHIFIYGDRGVGKTSLAQTAAAAYGPATRAPIILACDKATTFTGLISDIAKQLATSKSPGTEAIVSSVQDVNSAVNVLNTIGAKGESNCLVIIDEFDLISEPAERVRFADFIKQLGDRNVITKFIFCGIGTSLAELLGAHASCYRYLENIELKPLTWEARWKIINTSASSLGVSIPDRYQFRIAAISDGFPHYIHLICEKLYWEAYNDSMFELFEKEHYARAINASVRGIQQQLKLIYERATMKDTDDYHEVLWATADHAEFVRNIQAIYSSYLRVAEERRKVPIEQTKFLARLSSLRSAACGQILKLRKRGWYEFSENIMRGYVRLRAEEQGIELALEYGPGGPEPKSYMRVNPTKVPRLDQSYWLKRR